MDLMQLTAESEVLKGGKGDNPKGGFRLWLLTKEGKAALARGIAVEMEHSKDRQVAKEIATDHLKEDRKYYQKLAKVGLDEGIYDDPNVAKRDATDDLVDPAETVFLDDEDVDLDLAVSAVKNPSQTGRFIRNSPKKVQTLRRSLQQLIATASHVLQGIPAHESAMGVGSSSVGGNPGDKGSGIPIVQPAGQTRKRQFRGERLKPDAPASGMTSTAPTIATKSAFSKGDL